MKKIVFAIIMILLSSCDRYSFNSGVFGGYKIDSWSSLQRYIVLDKVGNLTHTNPIGYTKQDYTRIIRIDSNNIADTIYIRKEVSVIGNYVDYFVSDYKKYILVAQVDIKELWDYESIKDMEKLLTFRRKKGIYNYFIIDKVDDIRYGPYSQNKFIEKRKELGVPKELKMKFDK